MDLETLLKKELLFYFPKDLLPLIIGYLGRQEQSLSRIDIGWHCPYDFTIINQELYLLDNDISILSLDTKSQKNPNSNKSSQKYSARFIRDWGRFRHRSRMIFLNNEFYISEPFSSRITVCSLQGDRLRTWPTEKYLFNYKLSTFKNCVYVVDHQSIIHVYSPDGKYLHQILSPIKPGDIFVNKDFIALLGQQIHLLSHDGSVIKHFGEGPFSRVIVVDNIIYASRYDKVEVYSVEGKFLRKIQLQSEVLSFNYLDGILYIAEKGIIHTFTFIIDIVH